MESGRTQLRLDRNPGLCISSNLPGTSRTHKSGERIIQDSPDCTFLASATLVPSSSGPTCSAPSQTSNPTRPPDPAQNSVQAPRSSLSSSLCLDAVKVSLRSAGLSEEASTLAAKSRRESTRRTYDNRLVHFTRLCKERAIDPHSASLTIVRDFLLHLFNSGLQISTIKGYRSAIGTFHNGFPDGSTISSSKPISHLLRGMFIERPPIRRLTPSWDLGSVLSSLSKPPFEPAGASSLHQLTVKTAFLIAAASARRQSEIHALSLEPGHIRWEPGGVRLIPHVEFLTKNQSANFSPPDIFIPSLTAFSSVDREGQMVVPRTGPQVLHCSYETVTREDQTALHHNRPASPPSLCDHDRSVDI